MAGGAPVSSTAATSSSEGKNYTGPLAVVTSLFFMWGFITCMNDILIPKLKSVFSLGYTEAVLVQFCFFFAYFLISLIYFLISVSGKDPIAKYGYKTAIITGLLVAGVGCLLFYPAADMKSYPVFLTAFFILASGITILQISANPFVALLGSAKSASARLNMTQAFNSLGTTIAPPLGGYLIFTAAAENMTAAESADSVKGPYLALAGALVLLAGLIKIAPLPKVTQDSNEKLKGNAFQFSHLALGVICIFMYVGGEVSIGSFLVNYMGMENIAGLEESVASNLLSLYWGGAMIGRFFASFLLKDGKIEFKVIGAIVVMGGGFLLAYLFTDLDHGLIYLIAIVANVLFFIIGQSIPSRSLGIFAIVVVVQVLIGTFADGEFAMYSMLSIGMFNSIMFPTIFTLAIDKLGAYTSQGSSLLVMAIVGGALIPLLQGAVADSANLQISFLVPLVCYIYIAFYGFVGFKPKGPGISQDETV